MRTAQPRTCDVLVPAVPTTHLGPLAAPNLPDMATSDNQPPCPAEGDEVTHGPLQIAAEVFECLERQVIGRVVKLRIRVNIDGAR